MTPADLVAQRLRNQKLTRTTFRTPEQVVAWQGAVQSQDYIGGLWALGLRSAGLTAAAVHRAFDDGRILRTHILRPTWHFVTPADIRWMLMLTSPRVHAANGYAYRRFELDAKVHARCHRVFTKVLSGGKSLTRAELNTALGKAGIACDGFRLAYAVMHAELSGLICNGPRCGRNHTYALLEERVPPAPARSRDEALVELTTRYFTSHGPATVRDYSWWSGLSMRDAKTGVEMIASESAHRLEQRPIGECTFWFYPTRTASVSASTSAADTAPAAWLLPNYDEYFIAFKDREALLHGGPKTVPINGVQRPAFAHLLSIGGWLAGSWKRTADGRTADIDVKPFHPLTKPERAALDAAVDRYRAFMELPAALTIS